MSTIITRRGNSLEQLAQRVSTDPLCSPEEEPKKVPVWWVCLRVSVAMGIACWIVWDSLSDLVSMGWNESESSHVLLVPMVFAWIAWVRRRRLSFCSFRGRWMGVWIICAGWVLWAKGYQYQIQTFWHLGAIVLIAGTAITFLGSDLFWKFLPAWGALLFAVPLAARVRLYLAGPMEQVTAILTQSVAEVLGINCIRLGNQLQINGVAVGIVEACNGLRMVVTLFMACYVFAFAKPFRWWVRVIVLGASPVFAIACNVIRLVPTLWMFGNVSHSVAERFHDLAGWGMLVLAFGLLTGLANLLSWTGLRVNNQAMPATVENA